MGFIGEDKTYTNVLNFVVDLFSDGKFVQKSLTDPDALVILRRNCLKAVPVECDNRRRLSSLWISFSTDVFNPFL